MEIKSILSNEFSQVYQVGGSVRDTLLGKTPKDIDFLILKETYENIVNKLSKYGKCDIVGKSFGVIKFTLDNVVYDITIPRREKSTGSLHNQFIVETGEDVSLLEDLERRDFTINTILMTLSGNVVDYLDGQKDLKNRNIRMVFENCFNEDPLRMLRAIRFSCQLNFYIEQKTWEKLRNNSSLIKFVSDERINDELCKILTSNNPSIGISLLEKSGILKYILPSVDKLKTIEQNKKYHIHNAFIHTIEALKFCESNDLITRLAVLFHDIGKAETICFDENNDIHFYNHEEVGSKMVKDVLSNLKFSNDIINSVSILIANHMFDLHAKPKALRRLIVRVGKENIWKLINLRIADRKAAGRENISMFVVNKCIDEIKKIFESENALKITDLHIRGSDIIRELNVKPGPVIGKILNQLFDEVLDDKIENNHQKLIERCIQIQKGEIK